MYTSALSKLYSVAEALNLEEPGGSGNPMQCVHLHSPMFGGDQTPSHWHSDEVAL